jgi:hypothetical protein
MNCWRANLRVTSQPGFRPVANYSRDLSELVAALSDPRAYPFHIDLVEARQTHISAVFLAGDYA